MSNLKAIITMNEYGNYRVTVERHRPNCVPEVLDDYIAWTLRGARRKARRMLISAELADEYAKFREVIE